MVHSVFSVVAPVTPANLPAVRALLPAPGHSALPLRITHASLPTLHFASIVIFSGEPFEKGPETMPYIVLQCCIDGPIDEFLDRLLYLDGVQGGPLEAVFRRCVGFGNVPTFRAYLQKHLHQPQLCHIGVPGMRLFHIRSGQLLRHDLDRQLDAIVAAGGGHDQPLTIVRRLRTALNVPAPAGEELYYTRSGWVADPQSLWKSRLHHWSKATLAVLGVVAVVLGVPWALFGIRGAIIAAVLALVAFAAFMRWLHGNNRTAITLNITNLAALKELEDRGTLNHMCTFTPLQSGRFRRTATRLVLHTLELAYRTLYTDLTPGRLSGLATIHFGHWTLVPIVDRNNQPIGDALMFLSNYDGSWEAYLDDFVQLLANGVAAIWANCVGFRWPMHGPTFKAWARNGMTPWHCWYKGEPDVTVLNIHNNDAIRRGLLREQTPEQARLWLARFGSIKTGLERIAEPPERLQLTDVQGLVMSGYGHLPHSSHIPLRITRSAAARRWLDELLRHITDGRNVPREHRGDKAVNVAFTWQGLTELGLPAAVAHAFPAAFQEGIAPQGREHRSRALGDVNENDPMFWRWGGTRDPRNRVDLLLVLYARTADALAELKESLLLPFVMTSGHVVGAPVEGAFIESHGKGSLARLPAEHFGFVDGVSQPRIAGTWQSAESGRHAEEDQVKPGEFVLGYRNEAGVVTPGILVAPRHDHDRLLPRTAPGEQTGDFGRNGSFLVARQLRQHVVDFRRFAESAAASPGTGYTAEAIASRLVGRTRSGVPLAADVSADRPNDFTYADDPHGFRCPIGAHVRRANPRGSLGDDFALSFKATQRRRLLRRGRTYGDPLPEGAGVENGRRGMMFICLNSDIERQFEFVQQNWIHSAVFSGLYRENDPTISARSPRDTLLTMQADGVRERLSGLNRFVTVQGGDYFFLPGIRALRYLARLQPQPADGAGMLPAIAPADAVAVPAPVRVPWAAAMVARLERALPMLSLLMALRFQIILAVLLVLLGFAVRGNARTITLSFFLADRWYGVTIAAAMASLAASVIMITTRLTLMYGRRIGLPRARWLAPARWRDVLAFQLLALPTVIACMHWNAIDATWRIGAQANTAAYWSAIARLVVPALLGLAIGLSFVRAATMLQGLNPDARPELMFPPGGLGAAMGVKRSWRRARWSSWPRLNALGAALAARIPPSIGKGYFDYEQQRVLPGHAFALVLAAVSVAAYAVGAIVLSPWWSWSIAGRIPSIAYLLLLMIVAGWTLSAIAFFLDRYRLSTPLFVLFVLVTIANAARTDHYFPIGGTVQAGATPRLALAAAQKRHPTADKVVVVHSDGLGLVSSAWTAHVLSRLTDATGSGRAFADSLRLVSASSGSSVGALYFVNGYTKDGFRFDSLSDIDADARAPSSGEGGWGFVYPELMRTIAPILVPKFIDRGWAMEQPWKRRLGDHEPRLSEWRRDVEEGWRPATAFGVTVVETGEHKVFASYLHSGGPVVGESLEHDVSMVTAARLSATFPYISPPARPDATPHGDRVAGYHLIDSGVTENSGWSAAREWLEAVSDDLHQTCVLLVNIRSVPPRAQDEPVREQAWTLDLSGPLQAAANARRAEAAQQSRDMDSFATEWRREHPPLQLVTFALNDDTVPLSWNLGRADDVRLDAAWGNNRSSAQAVATFLSQPTAAGKGCSR